MPQQIKTCRRKTNDDEFYTRYEDAVRELHKYDLRKRKIICPCDTKDSNIYKYLKDCYYNVKCDSKEWRKVDYSKFDLVITNPPFSQVREFLQFLIDIKIDFIIIVSDVLRWSIRKGKVKLNTNIYFGKDAQRFWRFENGQKILTPIHCGWISNFQDDWGENKIIYQGEQND